ncbi:RNA polymerase sigma factor [Sphingomonas sp. PB4P5]|uniref:RNA polymerase sigma factor n=1 Tax=Parasphingomonas puruogangriensis TaxID=3096155 RepID=UPI002FC76228
MTISTRAVLVRLLGERYTLLRDRLSRRLGSTDLATEALHDTWLRLNAGADLAPVDNADAYLFRAALNSAAKLSARDRRALGTVAIDAVLELADDAPGPERIAIARSEIAALRRTLASLTRRQRDIFLESYVGEATHAELAERYGVSVRTIQSELRTALLHVALRFIGKDGFAKQAFKVSRDR